MADGRVRFWPQLGSLLSDLSEILREKAVFLHNFGNGTVFHRTNFFADWRVGSGAYRIVTGASNADGVGKNCDSQAI